MSYSRAGRGKTKPPAGAQIDWGHPLTKGLVACVPLLERSGLPSDLCNPANIFTPTGLPVWHGERLYLSATLDCHIKMVKSLNGLPYSFSFAFAEITPNGSQAHFSIGNSGNTDQFIHFRMSNSTTAQWNQWSDDGSYTVNDITNRRGHAVGSMNKDKLQRFFFDGKFIGNRTASGLFAGTSQILSINALSTVGSGGGLVATEHIYVWDRPLSDDEAEWISIEPYGFLTSGLRRRFSAPAVLAFTYSMTGTVQLSSTTTYAPTLTHPYSMTGTVQLSSSTTYKDVLTHPYTMAGVVQFSSTTSYGSVRTHPYSMTGTVQLSSSTSYSFHSASHAYSATGTIQTSSSTTYNPVLRHPYSMTGTIQTSSTTTYSRSIHPAYSMTGTVQFSSATTYISSFRLLERYSNLAETTVGGGGYTSGNGFLNVVSTAAPFKQYGSFRVVITDPDTGVVKVILRVLQKMSSTQWRVEAEGTDANALAADLVDAVLTEGAIDAIRSDMSQSGIGLSRPIPADAHNGDFYLSDDGYFFQFNGTAWVPRGDSQLLSVPDLSTFSSTHPGSSVATQVTNGILLVNSAAESGLNLEEVALPGTSFTVTARYKAVSEVVSGKRPAFGLSLRDSSGLKADVLSVAHNSGTGVDPSLFVGAEAWTDASTYASALAADRRFSALAEIFLRLVYSSGTRTYSFSPDGQNWTQIYSGSGTMTPTKLGFFVKMDGSAQLLWTLLNSWRVV